MIRDDERIDILGRTGEKIFSNLMRSMGRNLIESIDHFDMEKDFVVDGKKVEVKTEQPFVIKNAFTFRENQLRKCRSVDELYFVSIPPVFEPNYRHGGKIFLANPKEFRTTTYKTRQGINMIVIPIEQPAITKVYDMTTEEKDQLLKYAKSAYSK